MRYLLLFITIFCFSCKNEIHVSGIVVDETTKMPLDDVVVRTIGEMNGTEIHFIETRSKNGRFKLDFSSKDLNSNEIAVELRKEGYLTNMYRCFQDKPNDTLILVRNTNRIQQ
jgi:hypothetical protein